MKQSKFVQEGIEAGHDKEALEAYEKIVGEQYIEIENFEEAYNGSWKSDEDFVEELIIDTGMLPDDLPDYIYIDWERTARDIMMDYTEENGYYFRNL